MDEFDDLEDIPERPRDPAIDRAVVRVGQFFADSPKRVFYSRQIETNLERDFFHWITGKALLELGDQGKIQRISQTIGGQAIPVNFYAHNRHRYLRRELTSMSDILTRIFDPEFTHAVGRHAELMFDAAFGRYAFRVEAKDSNSWGTKTWTQTNHNLDRILTRDGLVYGVECCFAPKTDPGFASKIDPPQ